MWLICRSRKTSGTRRREMPNEEFIMWADTHRKEVTEMRGILDTPMPDELWALREQLVRVEAWNARMTALWAESERLLADAEEREMRALESWAGATSERRIHMKFETKQERRVRDVLKGLCRSMEYRLMLGMSGLKSLNAEREASRAVHGSRQGAQRPPAPAGAAG